jgi:hypothetical protein
MIQGVENAHGQSFGEPQAYKAAKTKNQDTMVDVSVVIADSCNACHRVYRRDKQNDTSLRCIPPSQ